MKEIVQVAESMNEREPRKRKCHQHESGKVSKKGDFQEYSVQSFSFTYCQVFKKLPEKLVFMQSSLSDTAIRENTILTVLVVSQKELSCRGSLKSFRA